MSDEWIPNMSDEWIPKTRLGKMVKNGEITSMSQALKSGFPIKEVEIVDTLLPDGGDSRYAPARHV